jgi:hypothetical protein
MSPNEPLFRVKKSHKKTRERPKGLIEETQEDGVFRSQIHSNVFLDKL